MASRANELKAEDSKLLASAPSHLRPLLKGKRLALWQAMLTYYEYPDKELVNDIVRGFPVTGWLPDSQVFPRDYKPPSLDVSALESLSREFNEHVHSKVLQRLRNLLKQRGLKLKRNCEKAGWRSMMKAAKTPRGPEIWPTTT